MQRSIIPRVMLALVALLLLGGLLAFVLGAFERLLDLWERALAVSPIIAGVYAVCLLLFAGAAVWMLWWLLRPPRKRRKVNAAPPTEDELAERIIRTREQGLRVGEADDELAELARRREAGELHIALYGQISAGKSSLVRALLPDASVQTDARGGTTRNVQRYAWQSAGGDSVYIADVPGFSGCDPGHAEIARDEALRAHLVVYLCEGDLTRDEWQSLDTLLEYGKPVILAVNKIDRFSEFGLQQVRTHLEKQLKGRPGLELVTVQTGGAEDVMVEAADGSQQSITRPRMPQIDALVDALQAGLEREPKALASLRDTAVLKLAAGKLDHALDAQRQDRADALVRTYTRRAVVGAMAALSPGSDLVIQGALGTQFVRELCTLYDAAPRDLQIDKLLKSANRRVRRNSALVLAVVGNGFKAFPGAGTVTGGLIHAVAYGLLFDTLGRAMVHTLRTRGELRAEPTVQVFESLLDENLLPRAKRLAALVLRRDRDESS